MVKVNELSIKINKAIVTKISVELDLETQKPTWWVCGKLVTDQGMAISDFQFSNDSWNEKNKIQVPLAADGHARELFLVFSPVILEKLGNMFKSLPSPVASIKK